jgi:hypothetical protein
MAPRDAMRASAAQYFYQDVKAADRLMAPDLG